MKNSSSLLPLASFLGFTGVGMGAFGAHALKKKLESRGMTASWQTAVLYQLFHATALLGLADLQKERAGQCMAVGNMLFSGSIYCLCLEVGPKKLMGPTTPIGGLLMMSGWLLVAF